MPIRKLANLNKYTSSPTCTISIGKKGFHNWIRLILLQINFPWIGLDKSVSNNMLRRLKENFKFWGLNLETLNMWSNNRRAVQIEKNITKFQAAVSLIMWSKNLLFSLLSYQISNDFVSKSKAGNPLIHLNFCQATLTHNLRWKDEFDQILLKSAPFSLSNKNI